MTPQERRPTRICPGMPSLQHLHLSPANHRLHKVCIGHADDLAIMHVDGDWQTVEVVLTKQMASAGEYLQTWKLQLSTIKTVSILTTG